MRRHFGSPAAGLCACDGIFEANFIAAMAERERRKVLIRYRQPDRVRTLPFEKAASDKAACNKRKTPR
jgi:hypothetical protein